MKAKRFILMLLVMLGSVTGAWAVVARMGYSTLETEFTQTLHGNYTNLYDYTCNSNQGTMVLRTNSAILLSKIEVMVWDSWSATSPNSIKIEGSNDKSEWITLADQSLLPDAFALRYVPVSTTELYQYFRLTLYGASGSSIVLRDIYIIGEGLAGDGTSQNPYILDKISYFNQYIALVAGGNNTACAKLTTDFDLNDIDWSPIDNVNFKGTIDGNGHSIKSLNNENNLFKNIGAATIKNLTLENVNLSATDENFGAFASQANGTNFQDCTVKGTISTSSTNTGGLVGKAIGCTFTGCPVNGLLNVSGANVGGLAGIADYSTTFTNCDVSNFALNDAIIAGGLVGNANGATFTSCNVEDFTLNNVETAGGLVGNANGATFTSCNVEDFTLNNVETAGGLVGNANGATFTSCNVEDFTLNNVETAGGLVGNSKGATFTQCSVSSDVTSSGCTTVGGLAGITDDSTTSTNCNVSNFSINDVENAGGLVGNANGTTLTNCNVEDFTANNVENAGGLVGNANGTTLTNCNVEDFTANNVENAGGLVGNANGATFTTCLVLLDITAVDCTTLGGLAGVATNNTTFTKCYSIGNYLIGSANAGALAGNAEGSTTFNRCYAATNMDNDGDVHLPVCGGGNATFNNSYYYGSGSETAVSKADVGSGRLAYQLNGSIDFATTGPYYQNIGTDKYPVLTGTNYVYRSRDGNSYTNTCPHNNPTLVAAYKPMTCISDGNAAYYLCQNPVCKHYCSEDGGITTAKESTLSSKPVIVKNHSWTPYLGLSYKDNISIDGTTYYNVTTLYTIQHIYLTGDYIVTYTNLSDESTMRFYEFFKLDGNWSVTQNIRYYVNGVERTELSHTLGSINYKEIVVDNLKKHDIVKIVYGYNSSENLSGTVQLYIAQYKPTGWSGEHSFVTKPADFNCVEGGYDEHCECELCGNAYSSNSHNTTDEDLVSLSNFWLEPNAASHTYALSNQTTDEGLLKYTCQNTNCKAHDPSHFMIPNCVGTTGVEVTTDGDTYSAVESKITVEDGNRYNSPVPFSIGSLEYQRTFFTNVWNPWFVPFDMTVSELSDKGVTVVACIESIHNYDTDMDGVVDKTVLEVILKKDGTLKANVPYMVKTGNSYTYPMNFTDMVLNASTDTKTVHTETGSVAYDFIGTYSGLTADEVNAASIFSLNSVGAMVHRTGEILPQRWYMKEVGKENVYEELSPAMARAISIRVIGEEDETTGIRTIYTEDRQTEELLPNGIFDLSGRKLSAPQHGKLNIINGKKQFLK